MPNSAPCAVPPAGRISRVLFHSLLLISIAIADRASGAPAEGPPSTQSILDGVVRVQTKVPAGARTARTLGAERDGSGIVIDDDGLVLTIGYLLLEADEVEVSLRDGRKIAASPVAYDHDTGFGLLRTAAPPGVKPIELGDSGGLGPREQVLVVSHGGQSMAMPALVVSRRAFAGSWEYLLESAIFTAPPHPAFGGAALLSIDGKLLGVGSLIVGNAAGPEQAVPGNMFVPIDRLKPILADLLDSGRSAGPRRPWIGLYSEEVRGKLFVTRLAPGGPAETAGLRKGDMVVGVGGKPIDGMADFYRAMWALGAAGTEVPLDVLRGVSVSRISVESGDRYEWLKRSRSY